MEIMSRHREGLRKENHTHYAVEINANVSSTLTLPPFFVELYHRSTPCSTTVLRGKLRTKIPIVKGKCVWMGWGSGAIHALSFCADV